MSYLSTLKSLNQCKAHLQTYPCLSTLFSTTVRNLSVGFLLSFSIGVWFLFLYALRESFHSVSSAISSCCLGIMLSEALLFTAYFWGIFSFTWTGYLEGIYAPSSRGLILTITLLLASASVVTGYGHCLREKGIAFLNSSCVLLTYVIALGFSSIQACEFFWFELFINDATIGSFIFTLTGLHFSHVFVGMILLFIYFWSNAVSFLPGSTMATGTSIGYLFILPAQLEYFALLYWHFVELVWLFIEFAIYSE